jgi:hypothetical protein
MTGSGMLRQFADSLRPPGAFALQPIEAAASSLHHPKLGAIEWLEQLPNPLSLCSSDARGRILAM